MKPFLFIHPLKSILKHLMLKSWYDKRTRKACHITIIIVISIWLLGYLLSPSLTAYRLLKREKHKNPIVNPIKLDDSVLLEQLRRLGSFSYMPNQGNMGDMLISSATMDWFDQNHLNWKRVEKGDRIETLVYGGGGIWTELWFGSISHVTELMKSARKVLILPSSFDKVPQFITMLDERFIVFCREIKSYSYLLKQNTSAKIFLDHDMALRLTQKIFQKNLSSPHSLLEQVRKLDKALELVAGKKNVSLFRLDKEAKYHFTTDLDLSSFLWGFSYSSREWIDFVAQKMLRIVSVFQEIHTDRLHVGIAAALMGVRVFLYDNSYGKISGVFRQSLYHIKNVELIRSSSSE